MTPLFVVWLAVAPAQPQWEAPEGCPGKAEVDSQVELLLLEHTEAPLEYRGRVELTPEGFRLTVEIGDTTRVVDAQDCARLGTAAALIIAVEHDPVAVAVAVEPIVQRTTPAPQPAPAPTPAPTPAPRSVIDREAPPSPSPSPREPEPPPPEVQGVVRLGMGVEVGLLPRVGASLSLAGGVQGERWRAELGVVGSVPRDVPAKEQPDFGARASLFAAQGRACVLAGVERLQVPLCAGAELGGLWAGAIGPGVTPRPRTQLWAGALASVALETWFTARVGLTAEAEVDVALRKPAVHVENVGHVFRVGALGARFLLGPRLRFP